MNSAVSRYNRRVCLTPRPTWMRGVWPVDYVRVCGGISRISERGRKLYFTQCSHQPHENEENWTGGASKILLCISATGGCGILRHSLLLFIFRFLCVTECQRGVCDVGREHRFDYLLTDFSIHQASCSKNGFQS